MTKSLKKLIDEMSETDPTLTKTDVVRSLALNLQQTSFDSDGLAVYVAKTQQQGDKVIIECTDGSVIDLTVKVSK